jgi:thiol-disulfide isomerase/thioredoxin
MNSIKTLWVVIPLAMVLVLIGCYPPAGATHPLESEAAVNFSLPDLDGRNIQLSDFRGEVVLLNFFGTTCAPCIQEIPWLIDFQKRYESKGLNVVALSMYGEGPEELKAYVSKRGMEPLNVLIGNDEVARQLDVALFPTTFLIDRQGNYRSRHRGLINRVEIETELTALLDQN